MPLLVALVCPTQKKDAWPGVLGLLASPRARESRITPLPGLCSLEFWFLGVGAAPNSSNFARVRAVPSSAAPSARGRSWPNTDSESRPLRRASVGRKRSIRRPVPGVSIAVRGAASLLGSLVIHVSVAPPRGGGAPNPKCGCRGRGQRAWMELSASPPGGPAESVSRHPRPVMIDAALVRSRFTWQAGFGSGNAEQCGAISGMGGAVIRQRRTNCGRYGLTCRLVTNVNFLKASGKGRVRSKVAM
jgi:hypothetical protein